MLHHYQKLVSPLILFANSRQHFKICFPHIRNNCGLTSVVLYIQRSLLENVQLEKKREKDGEWDSKMGRHMWFILRFLIFGRPQGRYLYSWFCISYVSSLVLLSMDFRRDFNLYNNSGQLNIIMNTGYTELCP